MLITLILLSAVITTDVVAPFELERAPILQTEKELVRAIVEPLGPLGLSVDADGRLNYATNWELPVEGLCNVTQYANRVSRQTFEEIWPDGPDREQTVLVHGEVWTDAIQTALDEQDRVIVPSRERPYYLDRPLVMRSRSQLRLGAHAELRMRPGCNFCMVRNTSLLPGQDGPVALGADADHDIVVTGGIWTTLATNARQSNGNFRARADAADSFRSHGVILFSNVKNLRIGDLTIRQCKPHAIQISNCSHFVVDRIRFEQQRRDGVHLNGPVSYGVIRDIRNAKGRMGDDMVALNAWDWKNTSMTFGPIHHVLVEDIQGSSTDAGPDDMRSEVRLLAGTKRFDHGATLECNIEQCVIRRVAGIRTFKMYDQPNLELGRARDFAEPIGMLKNIYFSHIMVERPAEAALFQIGLNGEQLAIHDVRLDFNPIARAGKAFVLVQIGPRSQTYKQKPNDPNSWVEIFSPNKDCTVSGLKVFDVAATDESGGATAVVPATLVQVVAQTINPDYPNTTPRGGTGKGILRD